MEQLITKERVVEAANAVRERADIPEGSLGIVLGSGFGVLADAIEDATIVGYDIVPHMVSTTLPLHAGHLVIGTLAGRPVICMRGRVHAYEGNSAQQVAFPICILSELGVKELVVTNAAGGINASFDVGDLMLIEDHVNLLAQNPCAGEEQPDLWPRYFDMTNAYSPELRKRALRAARSVGITLKSGVYVATLGPSFETPAEIRAFRALGIDAVGMSTVFETTAANALGMEVLGISMISNLAAGVSDVPLSMDDVIQAAKRAADKVAELLIALISDDTAR